MRARNIKPSFFKNEYLARLGLGPALAFTGLWCLADRKGRLEDRPDRIEAELFPFKFQKMDIEKILSSLSNCPEPFIIRYQANEKRYIQIVNFEKHQFPHHREKDSLIPALGSPGASPSLAHLNPESPILNPESLSPIPPNKGVDQDFDAFWKTYPKKVGKGAAEKAWAKINFRLNPNLRAVILDSVRQQKESHAWTKEGGQYIPNPATWLNQRRWEDQLGSSLEPVVKSPEEIAAANARYQALVQREVEKVQARIQSK